MESPNAVDEGEEQAPALNEDVRQGLTMSRDFTLWVAGCGVSRLS